MLLDNQRDINLTPFLNGECWILKSSHFEFQRAAWSRVIQLCKVDEIISYHHHNGKQETMAKLGKHTGLTNCAMLVCPIRLSDYRKAIRPLKGRTLISDFSWLYPFFADIFHVVIHYSFAIFWWQNYFQHFIFNYFVI